MPRLLFNLLEILFFLHRSSHHQVVLSPPLSIFRPPRLISPPLEDLPPRDIAGDYIPPFFLLCTSPSPLVSGFDPKKMRFPYGPSFLPSFHPVMFRGERLESTLWREETGSDLMMVLRPARLPYAMLKKTNFLTCYIESLVPLLYTPRVFLNVFPLSPSPLLLLK